MSGKGLETDRKTARRFLLSKQMLLAASSQKLNSALEIIQMLECVQLDPIAAVERNHHLVLHARNASYKTNHLEELISNGDVFEYVANAACIIPIEDYPMFKPIREYYQKTIHKDIKQLQPVMDSILKRLNEEGPLSSRAFKSTQLVKGYWDNQTAKTKDTSLALNILFDLGTITVNSRRGGEKSYIPTEKKIPHSLLESSRKINVPDAKDLLVYKYMRAYRVFDFEDSRFGWYKTTAKERKGIRDRLLDNNEILPLTIEDVRTQYYILKEDLDSFYEISKSPLKDTTSKGIKFLPPLDNLLWRRQRLTDLFDFNYKWEIYFPKEKRIYGYYAMPILYGDQLIGRMDPQIEDKQSLTVKLLQIEEGIELDSQLLKDLKAGLKVFASFHQVEEIRIEKTFPKSLLHEIEKI